MPDTIRLEHAPDGGVILHVPAAAAAGIDWTTLLQKLVASLPLILQLIATFVPTPKTPPTPVPPHAS